MIEPKWTGGDPNTVGYVYHLYDSPADTARRCHIEGELGKIEHPAMARIADILESKPESFDYNSHEKVVVYIAAMAMRSPAALGLKAGLAPGVKMGLVKGDYPNNPGPNGILRDVGLIRSHLRAIRWYPYWFDEKDGRALVTSDRPVGLYALAETDQYTGNALQPSPLEAALPDSWAKQAIFTFPVSSSCAALGFKGPKRELEREMGRQVGIDCDGRLPAWINSMTAWMANHVYTSDKEAKFLLPNPPGGPGETEFAPAPASGILLPVPRNRPGTIEQFVPLAAAFNKRHSVPYTLAAKILSPVSCLLNAEN
ncbi:MAG: hypothetical protein ACP5I8_15685 [Phycisphaerae bacterium]